MTGGASGRLRGIVRLLRVPQWFKNFFVFAPLVFSLNLFDYRAALAAATAFFAFSLAASAVYVINDIVDRENDSHHPDKKDRPLPAGQVGVGLASMVGVVCLAAGLLLAFRVNGAVLATVAVYTVMNLYYSFRGKKVIILDAMIIALGFVLRVIAGAFAISVPASSWLLVATFFLALLLGLAKRYNEICVLGRASGSHRQVLDDYNEALLRQLLAIASATTVVSYALYTLDKDVIHAFGTPYLVATLPFVVYGVFRYLYLVFGQQGGGDPTDLVLRDRPMRINLAAWILLVIFIIYRPF